MKQILLTILLFTSIETTVKAQTAQELYREGTNLLNNKLPDKAIGKFNRALELDSNLSYIYLGRAMSYMELKNWNMAISDFDLAFARENKKIDAIDRLFGVDELYSIEKMLVGRGRCKFELNNLNGALNDYEMAIKLNSRAVSPYYYKGICLIQKGNYREALSCFEKVQSVLPDKVLKDDTYDEFADLWMHIGNCHRYLSDNNLALFYFDKAQKKTAKNPELYFSIGNLKYNTKRWEEAITEYNKTLNLNPKHLNSVYFRGLCYLELKKHKEAAADFDLLIKSDPDNQLYYVTRGFIFAEQGKYREALKDYNKALELNPKDAATLIRRGHVYTETAEYDKAHSDFTNALSLDEKLKPYALNNRGNVKRLLKNYDTALNDIQESLKSDSTNAWAYLNRGLIYFDQNLYDKALSEFSKSIKQNNTLPNPYFHRANIFMILKQYDKAVNDFNKIQELDVNYKSKEVEKSKKIAMKSLISN